MITAMTLTGLVPITVFVWVILCIARRPFLLEVHVNEDSADGAWHPLPTTSDVRVARQRRMGHDARRW